MSYCKPKMFSNKCKKHVDGALQNLLIDKFACALDMFI